MFSKLVFFLTFLSLSHSAVLSIDYGADWFKVALVKPGVPLDVVLNTESKRKTEAVVTFKGSERYFGSNGANLVFYALFYVSNLVIKRLHDIHRIPSRH